MSGKELVRHAPVALLFALLLAVCVAAPGLAEEAPLLSRDEAAESPEAEAEREASEFAYANLSPSEEEQLLRAQFTPQLESIDADPARILEDVVLERIDSPTEALVSIGGEKALLEAEVPLRAPEEDGDLHKVELGLEETGDGYAPANPLVDLSLPASADEPIEIGDEGLAVTPVGVDASTATPIAGEDLFLPAVQEDTSLLLSPIAHGVELSALLASRNSPEQLAFDVDVPQGATLRAAASGGAEVVDGEGEVLAVVGSPHAADAQGTEVPVTLETEGSRLLLSIPHRELDVAYPLFVDPPIEEIWTNFADASKLSYWTWSWSGVGSEDYIGRTSCITTCWPGNGLYVRSRSNFAYPKGSWGRWWFVPQGSTTFMRRVVLGPVNYDAHGCTANEPHPYVGVWNDSSGWKVLMNAYPSGWGNYVDTGEQNLGAGTRTAFVGIEAASGANIACGHDYKLGGASLFLDDPENPTAGAAFGYPTGWVKAGTSFTISGPASDPGLGLYAATLSPKGSPPVEKKHGCDGHYSNKCPSNYTFQFPIGAESFDEGEKTVEFSARDALGKTSNTYVWPLKVDRTPPEIELAGQLAEATDETEGDAKDDKDKPLPLPVYNLTINTTDGRVGTVANPVQPAEKRSGVKKIEVFLDQGQTPVQSWETTSCSAGNCPLSKVFTLKLNELSADTDHYLRVLARDFAGNNPRERKIEFEYIPATGMKDEYVQQYFPLPDGSGNEDEEEHPARPELVVNVVSGNLVYRQQDLEVPGAGADLGLDLFYNSLLPESQNTEWGDGWTLAQAPDLELEAPGAPGPPTEATIVEDSGAVESKIDLPTATGEEEFDKVLQATVTKEADGDYEVADESGETDSAYVFGPTGEVEEARTGTAATVDYDSEGGELTEISVEDPATAMVDPETLEEDRVYPDLAMAHSANLGATGTGDGQFEAPGDVVVDKAGNTYVLDFSNNRVEKLGPAGQFLAKFGTSGSGDGQITTPRSLTIDAAGNLLVAESNRIQKFSPSGQFLSKFGSSGTGAGQFIWPNGIAIGVDGSIWVSDINRIQRFTAAGAFIEQVGSSGSGAGQLSNPQALDTAPDGSVLVADAGNDRVSVFDKNGDYLRQFGSSGTGPGQFSNPIEVESDADGTVWVGDSQAQRIQLFNAAGEYISQFGTAGSGTQQLALEQNSGIASDAKGRVWIGDTGNDRISRWTASAITGFLHSANFASTGAGDGQLEAPADVAADKEGNFYVLDYGNGRVEKFGHTGQFLSKWGSPGSAEGQLNSPKALAIDSAGNLLIVDNSRVQKFSPSGQLLSKFGSAGSGNGQFIFPNGIAIGPDGAIWVSDVNRVQRFTSGGQFIESIAASGSAPGQLAQPQGLDATPDGNVLVVDAGNDRVSVFDQNGDYVRLFGSSGTGPGQFSNPIDVESDADGNVLVADNQAQRVQLFNGSGDYVAQFGAAGSGDQQLTLEQQSGVLSDAEGRIWIADSGNDRMTEWLGGRYTPPTEPPPTGDDPQLEIDVSEGLVDTVEGEDAGTIDYDHSGDLLTAVTGPDAEADFTYDSAGRMTKVTLANGTYGTIAYEATYGRVKSVTVAVNGVNPKTTYFAYSDEPRRTTVTPPSAPATTYEIAADGSIFKWWNAKNPPVFDDLSGTLYDPNNRETSQPIAVGTHNLVIQAHDDEGIASIQVVANNDQLVDERTCEYNPAEPTKCVNQTNEWVTETGNWPPGIVYLEVIATDRIGESSSRRFWVNIPYTPPPNPEAEEPPRYNDILHFREEHGLDLDLKGDELKINDRIFDLMGAWNNANTPEGEVARATAERWGVPLRPVDAAELDLRIAYEKQASDQIQKWTDVNAASTFAGYYIDEEGGGLVHVGFTASQTTRLQQLLEATGLPADRLRPFSSAPTHSFVALVTLQKEIAELSRSYPTLILETEISVEGNHVAVSATDVSVASALLTGRFGSAAPITINYRATGRTRRAGRERVEGPIRAGDLLRLLDRDTAQVKEKLVGSPCTGAFGAFDPDVTESGVVFKKKFVLTAGHCMLGDHEVIRRSDPSQQNKQWIGIVRREGSDGNQATTDADAAAIRLSEPDLAPRKIFTTERAPRIPVKEVAVAPGIGTEVCFSGVVSNRERCGPISTPPEVTEFSEGGNERTIEVCISEYLEYGDSGSPAWIQGTGAAVGIMVTGTDETQGQPPLACFVPLQPYPGWGNDSAVFTHRDLKPLYLVREP